MKEILNRIFPYSLIFIIGSFLWSQILPAQQTPSVYADKGACPGECCTYRKWKTLKPVTVYQNNLSNVKIGELPANQEFEAITGIVYTSPTQLKVIQNHDRFKKGTTLYVYTSAGEGFAKVLYNGKYFEADLNNTDTYSLTGNYCATPEAKCWAKRIGPRGKEKAWWVKIKYKQGIGWILFKNEYTSGHDSCG